MSRRPVAVVLIMLIAACLAGPVALGADDVDADPPSKMLVEGRVLTESGEAVEGALVLLAAVPDKRPTKEEAAAIEIHELRTDATGAFALEVLESKRWRLRVEHSRLADASLEIRPDGDPVEVRLETGVTLTGRVLDAASGEPIPGITVTAEPRGLAAVNAAFRERTLEATTTDDEGNFALEALRSARWIVEAHSPGRALERVDLDLSDGPVEPQQIYLGTGYDLEVRLVDPQGEPVEGASLSMRAISSRLSREQRAAMERRHGRVRLQSDASGRVLIRGLADTKGIPYHAWIEHPEFATRIAELPSPDLPDDERVVTLDEGARVTGRLMLDDATPVEGSIEVAVRRGGERSGIPRPEYLRSDVPLEDGRFVAEHIPPGDADISIRVPDRTPVQRENVKLEPGATLSLGTIVTEEGATLRGSVKDADGAPVTRGAITVSSNERGMVQRKLDDRGRFRIGGFTEGSEVRLRVDASGFSFDDENRAYTVDSDLPLSLVVSRTGELTGHVARAASGQPVREYIVSALYSARAESGEAVRSGPFEMIETPTIRRIADDLGRLELELKPGVYTLRIEAEEMATKRLTGVEVVAGEDVDLGEIMLEDGASVSGVVLDAASKEPLVNARVRFESDSALWGTLTEAATDPEGRFTLGGFQPGASKIRVLHEGHATAIVEVLVTPDAPPEELRVELGRGGVIEGHVRDARRRPVARARVLASRSGSGDLSSIFATTGPDGRYRLENLAPGTYSVVRLEQEAADSASNLESSTQSAKVTEGGVALVDFPPASGVRVRGAVLKGAAGVPTTMMWIEAGDISRGMPTATTASGAGGEYEVALPKGGPYTVIVVEGDAQRALMSGTVPKMERFTVEIPDIPDTTHDFSLSEEIVNGVVYDAVSGEPLKNAQVLALSTSESASILDRFGGVAMSDAEGRWTLSGLGEEEYAISVTRGGYAPQTIGSVDGGGGEGLDAWLEPGIPIDVRVVDPDGVPLESGRVVPLEEGTIFNGARVQADGIAVLAELVEGMHEVGAVARGWAPVVFTVEVGADLPRQLTVTLARGAPVTVRVVDQDGSPAARRSVRLSEEDGADLTPLLNYVSARSGAPLMTDASGVVSLRALAPGSYVVEVILPDGREKESFKIENPETPKEIVLELR